jgi:hypothetical protein
VARHRRVDPLPPAPPSAREVEAAASVAAFALRPKPPKKTRDPVAAAREEMRAMGERGDWSGATGAHLVALYEWLHEEVYGAPTSELSVRRLRGIAVSVAGAFVKREFGGDPERAVEFLRWAWTREQEREAWRRANDRSGKKIGWRLAFSGELATEYRVDVARRSAR